MNTQLQEIIERGRQAAEERKRQEELDAIARQEEEAARYRNRLHKSELPEWMIEYLVYDGEAWYTLALPGCAPVVFTVITYIDGTHCYDKIGVRTPTELHYDQDADRWIVRYSYDHMPRRADNLDEAIALAAEYGESWHAMKAEAERRNAEGLLPYRPANEPVAPEEDQAGKLAPPPPPPLERIAVALERIAERLDGFSDNLAEDALRVNVLR